jgi:hypothetical protein
MYSNRLSPLFSRGVLIGAIYGLFSPILYIGVMFFVMFVLPLLTQSDADFDKSFAVSNFLLAIIFFGIPSVIVSTIVGILDGALVAMILASWRNKPKDIYAGLVGFMLSTILVLIINYLTWHNLHVNRQAYYPFWEFIFPQAMDLAHFTTSRNIFFVHSLMAVFLSTLGAWQINKKILPDQRAV